MLKSFASILVKSPVEVFKSVSTFHTRNSYSNPAVHFIVEQGNEFQTPQPTKEEAPSKKICSHPWPEWVGLMDKLLKSGYFEGIGHPGPKDANLIRSACLNFGRHCFHLIRYLSQQDIGVIAGCGCPSMDRKVVNSGKRLRASLRIEEGNVCSSCMLRGNCERAYVRAREDQTGRTVDVMRLLLTYGLDSVENKPLLNKRVEESARKLLKQIVNFTSEELTPISTNPWNPSTVHQEEGQINILMKHGDWICTKCNFLNFSRNVKCLCCNGLFHEKLSRLREEQDNLPLKKGDWICDKCHFMNFARNTQCFQCKEKPPKRQINPGEWECESCNYINFKRNKVCLKCDHRRPKAYTSAIASPKSEKQNTSLTRTRLYFGELNKETDGYVDEWEFVESDDEDNCNSMSGDQVAKFADFPVLGGKGELSRDAKKQETWKMEMASKSKLTANKRKSADEFKSSLTPDSNCFHYTDDEEIAEWFGHKSAQNGRKYHNS